MAAHFFILELIDTSEETTASFFSASQKRKNTLYSQMFPEKAQFEDPYNCRGALWTVGINPKKLTAHVDEKGWFDLAFIRKLLAHCENNKKEITEAAVQDFIDRWEFTWEYTKFVELMKRPGGFEMLKKYYDKRREEWIAFLRTAVIAESAVEVSLNL